MEMAFGTEMKGEVWPPKARAGDPNRRVGSQGVPEKEKTRKGKRIEPPFGARKCSFKRDGPIAFGRLGGAMKEGTDLVGETGVRDLVLPLRSTVSFVPILSSV